MPLSNVTEVRLSQFRQKLAPIVTSAGTVIEVMDVPLRK